MASYHLDCASGIAGDMFLGACLDLGMPLEVVAEPVRIRCHIPGLTRLAAVFTVRQRPEGRITMRLERTAMT